MRQFHLWQLLFITTVSAFAFAIARVLNHDTLLVMAAFLVVCTPCLCYGFAETVAKSNRELRKMLRSSLLFLALVTVFVISGFLWDGPSGLSVGIGLWIFWVPQLILLKFCSFYRSALEATAV